MPINTDFNLHCLPGFDFFSDCEAADRVLCILDSCYIKNAVLTPAFDSYRYSPSEFKIAAQKSLARLRMNHSSALKLLLAPTVDLSTDFANTLDISNLAFGETGFIYISLSPAFDDSLFDSRMHDLLYKCHLKPVFCNFDLFCVIYSEKQLYKIISTPYSAFQFNFSSLNNAPVLTAVKDIAKLNKPILFGSGIDNYALHTPNYRLPNFEMQQIFGKSGFSDYVRQSEEIFL